MTKNQKRAGLGGVVLLIGVVVCTFLFGSEPAQAQGTAASLQEVAQQRQLTADDVISEAIAIATEEPSHESVDTTPELDSDVEALANVTHLPTDCVIVVGTDVSTISAVWNKLREWGCSTTKVIFPDS